MSSWMVRRLGPLLLVAGAGLTLAVGCSKAPTPPKKPEASAPETELTFAPVQYDTTAFRVHFYWNAYDNDGEVVSFRYAVDGDSTLPKDQWKQTTAKDTILLFLVDPIQELKLHVFKVSAVDNQGNIDQTPASRAFSAKTLPPTSKIERGPAVNAIIGPNFTFEWSGIDPDGGETGGKVPVDSFQYLLLRVGAVNDPNTPPAPWHQQLPTWNPNVYLPMINEAVGDTLPYPHGDWSWTGIRALKTRFRNVTGGDYVFAVRAVDIAGATEKNLEQGRNIRRFLVSARNPGPQLIVTSSILNRPLDSAQGPDDFARKQLQVFEGETVSFTWVASAETYGGEIVGYTWALDDTSSFPGLDPRLTGTTLRPNVLTPGNHQLYVRAVDDGGLVTNLVQPILIVHPSFRDPGHPHSILFVDDSDGVLGNGSFPDDVTETAWWLNASSDPALAGRGPLVSLNAPGGIQEWDTLIESQGSTEGRKQPTPNDLRDITTIVWTTDFNNGGSIQTALFKTIAGGNYSELQGYLRAGGTLILTGWNIAQNSTGNLGGNLTYRNVTPGGLCATFVDGQAAFAQTKFPRVFMGIDNSVPNLDGVRSQGSADFTRGNPTPFAASLGFDTARIDTGSPGNGGTYKWNTNSTPPPFNPETQLYPGLNTVEGWVMAREFGCQPIQNYGYENPPAPIARVLYTYHGARTGITQTGAPSPREGLAIGEFVSSHDLGNVDKIYHPEAAVGRIAIFTFPLYFLKDADAITIMEKSFQFVDASPTLP